MSHKYKHCPLCAGFLKIKKPDHDEYSRQFCSKCDFAFYQNPTPSVLAVIENGQEVLLVKRKNNPAKGFWTLPGGFVEVGQNLEKALEMEIFEEIGLKVKSFSYFGSFVSQYKTPYILEDIVCTAFRVKVENYDFKVGSDVVDAKFSPKNNLPEIAPFRDAQSVIKKLIKEKL